MDTRETVDYGSAAAYAESVRKWVADTQGWQAFHHAAFMQMMTQSMQASPHIQGSSAPQRATVQVNPDGSQHITARYRTPSYMRRFVAEVIDFLFAFMIKLFVVYSLVVFEIIDLDRYERLLTDQTDLQMLIDVTQDLFPMEILGKLVCSIVEAAFISFGFFTMLPGQTPGKMMMGIQVISCHNVLPVPGDRSGVDVTGLASVPFKSSLLRALLKNLLINSLIPLSTVAYAFNYNRAIYDLSAKTIVVFKQ